MEESIKRKKGEDKAEAEQRKDRARNFISDKAAALLERSLKDRGFIAERGFKRLISPFAEMLEKRRWQSLGEHKEPGYAALVKEFFANLVDKEGKRVYVRGHWVDLSKEEINRLFSLRVQNDGSMFKKQRKEPEHQKIVDLLTTGNGEWKGTKKTPFKSTAIRDLTEEAKVWFYFISSVLMPSKHLNTMRREEAILLYALLKGYKINVGKIIEKSILGYSESKYRVLIPHPTTITRLCIKGGVEEEWGTKETYPRAYLLTLTRVTKGPNNRGKGKEKEVEEEKEYEGYTDPEHCDSLAPMQQEAQRSQSPFGNASPELRQIHQEQAESSMQNCNNAKLMEMLMSMRQEMKERDNQLKLQLQLRDEYMEADLKIRDQNLEDALRKRDEEWRVELEKRDQYWLNSIRHMKQSFRLMTYEQVNNRAFLESLAKRQRELIESNEKILDWAMKTVSNKKKVPLPQIRISDCAPYIIVPLGETNPVLPFLNQNPYIKGPSTPCKETAKNKTPSTSGKKELTPVEEVEEYLRMEASKEKDARKRK